MPQPVDLQTEMARIAAAERIQQIADRMSLAAQQRLAQEAEKTRVADETQVHQTVETENPEVDAEGRRKNPFAGRRKGRGPADSEEHGNERRVSSDDEGRHFDVSI